jgi:hypothetical protein
MDNLKKSFIMQTKTGKGLKFVFMSIMVSYRFV